MLYIINEIIKDEQQLQKLLNLASVDDELLFIEDGVYITQLKVSDTLQQASKNFKIYLLEPDLVARGLANVEAQHLNNVNYAGFVDLVNKHEKNLNVSTLL